MKIKRIIKRCDKRLKKAKDTSEAIDCLAEIFATITSMFTSEISGYNLSKGTQIALSAAFEVMSKETEKKIGKGFSDFDKQLKQTLVTSVKEVERKHDDDRL